MRYLRTEDQRYEDQTIKRMVALGWTTTEEQDRLVRAVFPYTDSVGECTLHQHRRLHDVMLGIKLAQDGIPV